MAGHLIESVESPRSVTAKIICVYTILMKILSTYSAHTSHNPSAVFAQWADPVAWPAWDPEIKSVAFDSPATLGKRGKLQPANGPALRFSITAFRLDEVFTDTGFLPGARLEFEHLVESIDGGSLVTVTVRVHGILSALWARILAPSMSEAARSSVVGLLAHLDSA